MPLKEITFLVLIYKLDITSTFRYSTVSGLFLYLEFETRVWFNSTAVANTSVITFGANSSSIIFGPLTVSDEGEIICDVTLGTLSYQGSVNLVVLGKVNFKSDLIFFPKFFFCGNIEDLL